MTIPCAECGHVSRDDARFCAECGAALARMCDSCGATLTPGARFCEACGAAAAGAAVPAAAPAREARRVLTVVFADLADSTALQEQLDAESVRRVMTRFYEQMRAVLEEHGGVVEKFIGDAVIALFGRLVVQEDDAVRAVRAAAAMVEGLELLNEELERVWGVRLRMRTAVNTGELVVSDTGAVVGDAMNTAARLEQAAPEGEVLIGEATWRLVRHSVELDEVQPLRAKGKSGAVRAWRVVSVPAADSRRTAAAEAPLVGRRGQLTRLRSAFDAVLVARACRLVSVVGSPGVGKSRLVREFGDGIAEEALVVEGHCEPTGEGITFLPVAEILRSVAGIGETDPSDQVREKLAALVPEDDPDRERLVERSAGVLGVVEPASAQETFWALRRGVEFLARERPLVLVLDDLHWGQPMLLDLVEHLVEWVRDAPVLLVALARPELRDARDALVSGRRAVDVIELEPLDEQESLQLVDGLLGEVRVPVGLRTRILEVTEGNPLFLGETLRMLVDEGALQREGNVWVPAEGLDAIEVPPTIQALLAARIERLRTDERSVVERASVIGKQFYRGAVAELLAPPVAAGIDGHLEALRRKDMVEPEGTYWIDEPVYRFHHVLIRDAAYRSLLKEARSELHERFAEWLQEKAGELVGEHEEVIAFHLEQAHEYRRELGPLDDHGRELGLLAEERLWSAGRRALAREDLAAAANLLSRALARDAGDQAELLWDLCDAVLSAGDTAVAARLVERYADGAGDGRADVARAQVLRGQLANLTGAPDVRTTALALTDAAAVLAERSDREGEARAHQVAAGAYARLGQVGAVEEALDRALAGARAAGDRRRTTAVLAAAPRAALWGPSPVVRASGRCLDVVRILRMTPGNRHVEAIALRCQAVLEAMRGRDQAARDILAAGRTTLQELGLAFELNETAVHAGIVELLAEDPAAACEHLRAARAGFEALGAAAGAAQAAALLARALVGVGNPDAVTEAIDQSEFAEAHSGEDLKTVIIWTSARGQALARTGDVDTALPLARRAMALAEPTDALADKADAAIALSEVLVAAGSPDEAREVATSAGEWYEAKGHRVGMERARRLADIAAPRVSAPAVTPALAAHSPPPVARAALGDRPPERFRTEFQRRFNARDIDGCIALTHEDWVQVDHRKIGWGAARGRERARELLETVFIDSPDLHVLEGDVMACDDQVIVERSAWVGTAADGGGLFEIPFGAVSVIEDGRRIREEVYEPEDLQPMIARYAELGGGQAELGDRPPERYLATCIRGHAAQDMKLLTAITAEDFSLVDHRQLGWEAYEFADARRPILAAWETFENFHLEVDEVLACDDRVIAARTAWRGIVPDGGGPLELPVGLVILTHEGRALSWEQFEPDDREQMLARFAKLSEQQRLGFWTRYKALYDAHDLEGLLGMIGEDWVLVDHRSLGWEEWRGIDGAREQLAAAFELLPDLRLEIEEELAGDGRVLAARGAWRGSSPDGGPLEIPFGMVVVLDGERWVSADVYEPDDFQPMMARYAELGGGQAELGDRPPERYLREWIAAHAARHMERLKQLRAPGATVVDHRPITGPDGGGAGSVRAGWEVTDYLHLEIDEILACDDRAIAFRVTWRGALHDGGGRFEGPTGYVTLVENGRGGDWHHYEPDDRASVIACYVELGGGLGPLGGRPPERWFRRLAGIVATQDGERLPQLYAEDYRFTDHRHLSWETTTTRLEAAERVKSTWHWSTDVHMEVNEVLACDERAIAVRITWVGGAAADDGGGRFTFPLHAVVQLDGEEAISWDQYEPEDRDAALTRFAELSGHDGRDGRSIPERHIAEWTRRWEAGDLDDVLELHADDWLLRDHRAIRTMEEQRGRDDARRLFESLRALSPDVRLEIDEVLACDDRLIAYRHAWRGTAADGGGNFEAAAGFVTLVENGRERSVDQYEADDHAAMIARYAELGGGQGPLGDKPPEQLFAEFARRYPRRDLDGMLALYADEFVLVDHRQLGWGEVTDRDGLRTLTRSGWDSLRDLRFEVDEVLACDERIIALRIAWRGHALESGGATDLQVGMVGVLERGRLVRVDQYDPAEREAMLARFTELSESAPPGGQPRSEQLTAEFVRRYNARNLDAILQLYRQDFKLTDHRSVGWAKVSGLGDYREALGAGLAMSDDITYEVDEIVASDERVIAFRAAWRGTAADGGGAAELAVGIVTANDGALIISTDVYEPHDRQGMIARYAELGGGQGSLGARPPECLWRDFARRFAARDLAGLRELYHEDTLLIDHRNLAWDPARGADALLDVYRSILELLADARIEVDEVIAADERVIALRFRVCGSAADGGGMAEVDAGGVTVVEEGRVASHELYAADQREAMLSRFAELSTATDRPRAEVLHAAAVERYNAHDLPGLMAHYASDVTFVDHRRLAWVELHGSDQVSPFFGSSLESSDDIRWEVKEVLAADEETIAISLMVRGTASADGSGEFEYPFGYVTKFAGDLIIATDFYDTDDRRGLIARYAELGGGQAPLGNRPPERFWVEFCRRWATLDAGAITELYGEDWIAIEHRKLGWEEMQGWGAAREHVRSVLDGTLDIRCEIGEVLACDDRVIALQSIWRGSSERIGGSTFEIRYGTVTTIEDGRIARLERFDSDDRDAMLECFARLSDGR